MKFYFILCLIFNYKLKQAFGNDDEVKVEPINSSMVIVHYDEALDYKNVLELNEVWLLDSIDNTVAKALREGNESSLLTQKINVHGTLTAAIDPCSCQYLKIKYFYKNKRNKSESYLFGFYPSPVNYFNANPNELVCVSPENQPIFNNFPNQTWIPNCVTKVRIDSFSPKNFQGNGSVSLFIQKCSKFRNSLIKIDYSKSQLHDCSAGQDNESFPSELVAAFQKKSTWFISGIFCLISALFATLIDNENYGKDENDS